MALLMPILCWKFKCIYKQLWILQKIYPYYTLIDDRRRQRDSSRPSTNDVSIRVSGFVRETPRSDVIQMLIDSRGTESDRDPAGRIFGRAADSFRSILIERVRRISER